MEMCICQFTSTKSRIALQVARKIVPCDRAICVDCLTESSCSEPFPENLIICEMKWPFNFHPVITYN